jgi:hypothetical protein
MCTVIVKHTRQDTLPVTTVRVKGHKNWLQYYIIPNFMQFSQILDYLFNMSHMFLNCFGNFFNVYLYSYMYTCRVYLPEGIADLHIHKSTASFAHWHQM